MHNTYLPVQVSLYVAFDNKPNLDPLLIHLLTRQTSQVYKSYTELLHS